MTLVVQGLHKYFDGVRAVQGISLEVHAGECVALIGPNGAGKSTTFACIAGQHAVTQGSIHWAGHALTGLSPAQRLARGVARTFQVARVFDALTVRQNVQLLMAPRKSFRMFDMLDDDATCNPTDLLRSADLLADAGRLAGALPYGAKKRLELAMALAGISGGSALNAGPRLLLLDEPAAGLAVQERADLMRWVHSLAHDRGGAGAGALAGGCAVLYTEHNMDAVFGVADRVLVLMDGHIAAQGSPAEVAVNPLVQSRYLGNALQTMHGERHA